MLRIGILTVSDKGSEGQRADASGPAIADRLRAAGYETVWYGIVPDEMVLIEGKLLYLCDIVKADVVLTTGGTRAFPARRDPGSHVARLRPARCPGIAEAMRVRTAEKAPCSMLSRGVAVTRGQTLIVNFPGSPKAVRECMDIVLRCLNMRLPC